MKKQKVWVWFKGGLQGGKWVSGFLATKNDDQGYFIERSDFISCRLPDWRISFEEPEDEKTPPYIPEDATWKYI